MIKILLVAGGSTFLACVLFYWWWGTSGSLTPLQNYNNSGGNYLTAQELPVPRTEAGATVCNNQFVIAGGINSLAQTLVSVMIYNPGTESWSHGPDLPEPINHPALASLGDTVYVVGGFGPLGLRLRWFMFARWDPLATVYKLHVPTGTWSKGADMPLPRGAGGLTRIDSTLWYVGGIDENREITNTVFKYDILTNTWSESVSMPTKRDHLRVESVGRELFAISGRKDDLGKNLDVVESMHIDSLVWKSRAPIPTARGGLGSAVIAGKIYTFGGEMTWTCLENMERYDPVSDTWEVLDPMPEGRHGIQSGVINGSLHLASGGRHPRVSISGIHRIFTPANP